MDNPAINNDKENVDPVNNVPEVEGPRSYTIESENFRLNLPGFHISQNFST